jgi:hypothetical protein
MIIKIDIANAFIEFAIPYCLMFSTYFSSLSMSSIGIEHV